MLGKLKRGGVNIAIKKTINEKIKDYGKIEEIDIDSKQKKCYLKMDLNGESKPISLIIDNYSLKEVDEGGVLCIKEISSSREWLTKVLNDFVKDKDQKIPKEQYSIIKMFF